MAGKVKIPPPLFRFARFDFGSNASPYSLGIYLGLMILFFHPAFFGQTFAQTSNQSLAQPSSQSLSTNSPKRLSEIISPSVPNNSFGDRHLEGLMWTSPAEIKTQEAEKLDLLNQLTKLKSSNARFPNSLNGIIQLEKFIAELPVTGRVLLSQQDPRWLEVHPKDDPVISSEDSLTLPKQSRWVTVIRDDGRVCQLPFRPKVAAQHYTTLCDIKDDAVSSWAWVIQADGSFQKVGLTSWNEGVKNEAGPGSWIWVPSSPKLFRQTIDVLPWTAKRHFTDEFSNLFAAFLATQGPSDTDKLNQIIRPDRTIVDSPLMLVQSQSYQPTEISPVSSDWGGYWFDANTNSSYVASW
jgi:hypothetical protein